MNRSCPRLFVSALMLVLSAASFAKTKEQVCSISDPVTVEHRDGVTVRTLSFLDMAPLAPGEKRAVVNAHVYVPDGDGPLPVILFYFSAIHSTKGTTDLRPFAFTLARGGAASIVLERTVQWEPYDEASNRSLSVMNCASRWLDANISGGVKSAASAGSYHIPNWSLWTHGIATGLQPGEFNRPPMRGAWGGVGFGTMGPAEYHNTETLQTAEGQLHIANDFYGRNLQLKKMPREWFHVETKPDGEQVAAK